jgi:hypothetical protein
MMCRTSLLFALLAAIVVMGTVSGSARAGFITGTINVDLPDKPGRHHCGPPDWAHGPPPWVFENLLPTRARLRLTEVFGGNGPFPVMVSGETDTDPIMAINKSVENGTNFDWFGYRIAIEGTGATFEVGTASSDRFSVLSESPLEIAYYAENPSEIVAAGETVSLGFDLNIATIGAFSFTLTQESVPVPEPATLAFFGLGSLGLVAMRRRAR